MDIFVPYYTPEETRAVLRPRELDTTVVTSLMVLVNLHDLEDKDTTQTSKLPMIRMWEGHEPFLCNVAMVLNEARSYGKWRVFAQTRLDQHLAWAMSGAYTLDPPPWWGDPAVTRAYRSALIRLNPNYYGRKWPEVPGDLQPMWPRSTTL